ncbi:MAG: N-acetylmuramoyl-L-alanine amidase [Zavarzinia sp.]|nr:N-acetylmuramoyl-L-alanine amidase [Zavarzinia sp.]
MNRVMDRPSPNRDSRNGVAVSILMIHYTGMKTGAEALARLCDPEAKVSSHYLVEEDGDVFRLVPEELRAWHAGQGSWHGIDNINAHSIGIELVNPGHEWGYRHFPPPQMKALASLSRAIINRWGIDAFNVIGHSDGAPLRKTDPGELFDWPYLAGRGVGFWIEGGDPVTGGRLGPGESGVMVEALQADLAAFGYGLHVHGRYDAETRAVVAAFQRHWRPAVVDGVADEDTRGRLARLLRIRAETVRP